MARGAAASSRRKATGGGGGRRGEAAPGAATAAAAPPSPLTSRLPLLTAVLILLLLARLSPWMAADLWFDEVLTIDDYVIEATLADLVTRYPAPNHHVLFSVLLWGWVRALDPFMLEWLLRLPCALFAAGMIALAVLHWRKWLGPRVAVVCGVTLAASLVVASFAWQLRGYALTMLLASLATSGALELVAGSRTRGRLLYLPSAVLLPLVVPTNALLLAAHWLFLAMARPREVPLTKWAKVVLLPVTIAGAVGCSWYLIVWRDLPDILRRAEGWTSAGLVAGAWGVGLLAHFGPVLVLFLWRHRGLLRTHATAPSDAATGHPTDRADLVRCWQLLGPMLVLAVGFLIVQRPAPFPRTFLVLLPTATFAVFLACRGSRVWARVGPLVIAAVIVVHGLLWQLATGALTAEAVARGERPQNLVMQYYRGRSSVSEMTLVLMRDDPGRRIALLTDFHDMPATRYYWRVAELPAERVMSGWLNPPRDWRARFGDDVTLMVQATTEARARELIRTSGALAYDPPRLQRVVTAGDLSLWAPAAAAGGAGRSP